MPHPAPDLPVLTDANGEFVRAHLKNRPDQYVLLDLADWRALWADRKRLTLAVKPYRGIEYVTLPVLCGSHWRAYPVARAIMKPPEDALVCFADADPLNCRRHNLRVRRRGEVATWRNSIRYFGEEAA